MNAVAEYIPSPNHHQKAFDIVPAKDWTEKILNIRREVFRNKNLSTGAKLLFCYLLDFSLLWTVNRKPGVITISTTKLSEELGCSKRVLFKWKRQLVAEGYIWITPWAIPNAWPIDTYHICVIDPPNLEHQTTVGDGMWGNGARRQALPSPGLGARKPGQLNLTVTKEVKQGLCTKQHRTEGVDLSIPSENATGSRTKVPLPVAQNAPGSGKKCDGEPHNVRRGAAENATGSRTKEHLPAAQNAPGSGTKQHSYKETQIEERESTKRGTGLPPGFEEWNRKIKNWFPGKLEKLKTDLVALQKQIDPADSAALADVAMRIEAINCHLYGGPLPKPKQRPARSATTASPERKEMTDAELLEAARSIVGTDLEKYLTPQQRELLAKAEARL